MKWSASHAVCYLLSATARTATFVATQWALVLGCWLPGSGCEETRNRYEDLALSVEETAKAVQLQTLFESHRVRVGSVYLASDQCKIYRSREQRGVIVAWDLVKIPRSGYPAFLTGCYGMGMEPTVAEDGYLYFRLCQGAYGASGGCQRGGWYRTKDGMAWECHSQSKERSWWAPCTVRS